MRFANWMIASVCIGLVFVATGCKPKVGGKCKSGAVVCTKDGALFCADDNKYATLGCHGPLGCLAAGTDSTCDASLALAGDGCETEGNIACSVDKKAQLDCKNHKWVLGATCKGAKGCELRDEELFCDHTIADKDDPCHRDGQIACMTDKTLILKCQDNVMRPVDSCRGPASCTFEEHPEKDLIEFNCDDSVAKEGDPCNANGFHACDVDKKAIHICQNSKFTQLKACAGPKGCVVDATSHKLSCDQGTGGFFSGAGNTAKVSQAAGGEKGTTKAKTGADAAAAAKPDAGLAAKPDAGTAVVAAAGADAGAKTGADAGVAAAGADAGAKTAAGADAGAKPATTAKGATTAATAKPATAVKVPTKK